MSSGIIIQARTCSTRLPNKVILPFYKNKNVLEIIVNNIKKNSDIKIAMATTVNQADDVLIEVAEKLEIDYFRGSEENVLQRFVNCAEKYNFKTIVRICSDNPFLDADYLKTIFESHTKSNADYTSYKKLDGTPVIKTHYGVFCEVVELSALKKVQSLTNDKLYIEHVTNYIYTNPTEFKINLIPIPEFLQSKNIRLTVDSKEDWDILTHLYKTCKEKYGSIKTDNVVDCIMENENIQKIMKQQIVKYSK